MSYDRDYYLANRDRLRKQQAEYHVRNAETIRARAKKWREDNPEWKFETQLRITHELTPDELRSLGTCCAICGSEDGLVVDHNHRCTHPRRTGKSVVSCKDCHRGRLCGGCNKALGFLGDDPERAEAAARYLRGT